MATEFSKMSNDELWLWIVKELRYVSMPYEFGGIKWIGENVPTYLDELPRWPESVDAALTLPFLPYMVKIDQNMTELWECALRRGGEDLERYFAYAKTPARAICEAWAAMREAEGDNGTS